MRRFALFRTLALILFESGLIFALVAVAAWVHLSDEDWAISLQQHGVAKAFLVVFITQVCLYFADLYSSRQGVDRRDLFVRIMQALGAASFILAGIYLWLPDLAVGRGVFLYAAVLVIAGVIGWRVLIELTNKAIGPRERLLLVGTSPAAVALAKELHEHRVELGVEIVGFVDPDPARVGAPVLNPGVIGTVSDIPGIVQDRRVDRVVVSLADARGKLPMDQLLQMKLDGGVTFDHLPTVYEEYTGKIAIENLRPSWLIFSGGFKKTRLLLAAKRALDVVAAAIGLVLLSPVMMIVALLVRVTSKGPALYHQERVGQGGRVFTVHKFRSMRQDAEAGTGAVWAQAKDSRITPIGGFLRRTRLD
jgi:hypothetical protein